MTIFFTIIGLIAFYKGKIYGRNGYYIENNILKVIGLMVVMIDMMPILCICSASVVPSLISSYGILTLFFSVIANMLIVAFSFVLFSHRSED